MAKIGEPEYLSERLTPLPAHPLIADRWDTLVVGVSEYDATEANAQVYNRLHDVLRELAGRIIRGVRHTDEYDRLVTLEGDLIMHVKEAVIAFGIETLEARAAR